MTAADSPPSARSSSTRLDDAHAPAAVLDRGRELAAYRDVPARFTYALAALDGAVRSGDGWRAEQAAEQLAGVTGTVLPHDARYIETGRDDYPDNEGEQS